MKLSEMFIGELQQEQANSVKMLEGIPQEKWNWRPHAKSWTMGELASHIANLPNWLTLTVEQDELDMAPPGEEPVRTPQAPTAAAAIEALAQTCEGATAALKNTSEAHLQGPWKLLAGGQEIFTMPRAAVIRTFVLNHIIHHRAQLSVYRRLNDLPVPGIYGPSADETGM